MKTMAWVVLALGLGGAAPKVREVPVLKPRAAVMEKPQFWGRTVFQMSKGQVVKVLDESRYPWVKVEHNQRTGWLHASNYEESRTVSFVPAADADAKDRVSDRAMTLAARGIGPEYEAASRELEPELMGKAFESLDVHAQAGFVRPGPDEMRKFVADGQLGGAVAEGGAR